MAEDIPWEKLFEAAVIAQKRAHAPYSKFPVGAAVLTDDGRIHAGANVENSSYGLTVCAERNAIGRAVGDGAKRVKAVAVIANTKKPCPPCGMCRQVIAEFADPKTPVRSRTPSGDEQRYTLEELLPHMFTKDYL